MKKQHNIQLDLSLQERKLLRKHGIKKFDILNYDPDQLSTLMETTVQRAKEIFALADFQRIPSLGIKAAGDFVFMGFYAIEDLKGEDGATITDRYEVKKGYRTDVCVEDQFRLAVHFAKNQDYSKRWWDFTAHRKAYRRKNGYPATRPSISWYDLKKKG